MGPAMPTALPADQPPAAPLASYAQTPRPYGRELRFALFPDALEVDDQRRTTRIPLAEVVAARLTYEPRNTMTRGFRLRLIFANRRSVSFTNYSWRSLVETENRAVEFRAFLAALLPAIAQANPDCAFQAGRSRPVWIALVVATAGMLIGLGWILARALPQASFGAGALLVAFAAAFAWIATDMAARNRPRRFAPDAPPADLLP